MKEWMIKEKQNMKKKAERTEGKRFFILHDENVDDGEV